MIGRVLDAGALGVIVPDVRTATEAEAAVRAAKYPPAGRRSVSGALLQFGFRPLPAREAFAGLDQATMVIVQCELQQAVDNAEAIAAVNGVDMILTGTNDFLADIGHPGDFDHPAVRAAHERVIAACLARGKHAGVGGLGSRPALIAEFIKKGARFVSVGTDLALLLEAGRTRTTQLREAYRLAGVDSGEKLAKSELRRQFQFFVKYISAPIKG